MVCLTFLAILRPDTFLASATVKRSMIPSGLFQATKTRVVIFNGFNAIITAK